VELDKRFEEIEKLTQSGKVDVRIIVPGTESEIEQFKKKMNLSIPIQHSTDLAHHQALGFVAKENGQTYLNRGFAITSGGKIMKSVTTNEAGLHSLEIVEEAIKMSK
jgi:hypothetical protein